MIRDIVRMGDPGLLRVAQPVRDFDDPALAALIEDMFDTMASAGGVGLAAPQIGADLRVIVFGFERSERYAGEPAVPRTVLINPTLVPLSEEREEGWEGCLSIPGLRGAVPRWRRVRFDGFDAAGRPVGGDASGFHARVLQHECDHLDGTLYPMRMEDFTRFGFTDVLFPTPSPGGA